MGYLVIMTAWFLVHIWLNYIMYSMLLVGDECYGINATMAGELRTQSTSPCTIIKSMTAKGS